MNIRHLVLICRFACGLAHSLIERSAVWPGPGPSHFSAGYFGPFPCWTLSGFEDILKLGLLDENGSLRVAIDRYWALLGAIIKTGPGLPHKISSPSFKIVFSQPGSLLRISLERGRHALEPGTWISLLGLELGAATRLALSPYDRDRNTRLGVRLQLDLSNSPHTRQFASLSVKDH